MVRRQIQLTAEQDEAVRRAAVARGLSIAAVIRELVEESLRSETVIAGVRARRVVGAHASGLRDVSREHDRYLADSLGT
jgi:hypothetical protein